VLFNAYLSEVSLNEAIFRNTTMPDGSIFTGSGEEWLAKQAKKNPKQQPCRERTARNNSSLFPTKAEIAAIKEKAKDKTGADFRGADLSDVDMQYWILTGADFTNANLIRANLKHAKLMGAKLIDADLSNANLESASLRNADLSGAHLIGAELYRSIVDGAIFSDTTLSNGKVVSGVARGSEIILTKHLYIWDWASGGYNSCMAASLESAQKKATEMGAAKTAGHRTLVPVNVRLAEPGDRDRYERMYR
jgi:uncharacterized protein YjbI with pentapeptide repeats